MTLTADIRTELAAIIAANSDLAVTVVIDGVSGTGLRVGSMQATEFGENGETGVTTEAVRVSGATFERPDKGKTILIGGDPCVVTEVDGSGIVWVIRYRKARPVEGV